mgnify:CR=1 FL=1
MLMPQSTSEEEVALEAGARDLFAAVADLRE